MYDVLKKKNPLHLILKEDSMSTRERRETLMKKYFELCNIRYIDIVDDKVGSLIPEQVEKKHPFFAYTPPEELLTRYVWEASVFKQFLSSGKQCTKHDGLGIFHSDFFQSAAYEEILDTLNIDWCEFPPLLLGLYM